MTTYLVTGGAGFIGSNVCDALVARGELVICVDNFNDYYAPDRKRHNIRCLEERSNFKLYEADIRDAETVERIFAAERPTHVAHFAGMANPRYSIAHPHVYAEVNVGGTLNLLESGAHHGAAVFVLMSSSSVYGVPEAIPFREDDATNRPLSQYGATKKASEVLAFTYHHLYGVPTTVIRPFTVYGPRGRPDMTPHLFVAAMERGEPITLYEGGRDIFRDWTYVGDFVEGILSALDTALPFEIVNLGNAHPVEVRKFVALLTEVTGLDARVEERPLPKGEPRTTYADIGKAQRLLGYNPRTTTETGLQHFWEWYQRDVIAKRKP
jgi:UDP-glucuronate 4-epimerase